MLYRFASRVAMRFERKHDQPDRAARSANGRIHALGLDWERAGVVVSFTMDQEYRRLNIVSVEKRRDLEIKFRRFPENPALALEAERRKCAIVSAAPGNPRAKQVGVGQ